MATRNPSGVQSYIPPVLGWRDRRDANNPGWFSADPTMNLNADDLSADRNNLPESGPGPQNDPRQFSKGGPVTKVTGPPKGEDDGTISAQRGEYVLSKTAVEKYGRKLIDAVNDGSATITVDDSVRGHLSRAFEGRRK